MTKSYLDTSDSLAARPSASEPRGFSGRSSLTVERALKPNPKKEIKMTNQMKTVALSSIVADDSWNSRIDGWDQDHPDETVEDFAQLKESIEAHGIETPLAVMPVGGRSKKFRLVAGFRRFRAATELGFPKVPVVVHDFTTEAEARSANLRENQERENLTTPDLAWGVQQLHAAYAEEGVEKTQRELALEVGVSQAYVSALITIATQLDPKLFTEWREGNYDFNFRKAAEIAKLPKSEQRKAWDAHLSGVAAGASNRGQKSDADKLRAKGEAVGKLLGKLAWLGIDPHEPSFSGDFPYVEYFGTEYNAKQRRQIAKAAQGAYEGFLTEEEETEEEEA